MNTFDKAYKNRPLLFGTEATEELLYTIKKYNISGVALELGCGDGRDTKHVLNQGLKVCALERSKYALETLEKRSDIPNSCKNNLTLVNTDVMSFAYEESRYDFVYAVTLLDHLTKYDYYELIPKILSSIKPGGYFFMKVHTVDDVGNTSTTTGISEFASEIKHFFDHNELIEFFFSLGRIVYYLETQEEDTDHGPKHTHSFASLLLKKEKPL